MFDPIVPETWDPANPVCLKVAGANWNTLRELSKILMGVARGQKPIARLKIDGVQIDADTDIPTGVSTTTLCAYIVDEDIATPFEMVMKGMILMDFMLEIGSERGALEIMGGAVAAAHRARCHEPKGELE